MINDFVKWLKDPSIAAKKRTAIVLLVAIVGGLRASTDMMAQACVGVQNIVCSYDPNYVASLIEQLINLINSPEGGAVAFLTGAYAIFSGFRKDKLKRANAVK